MSAAERRCVSLDQTNDESDELYDKPELMLLALRGIFVALDLIESGNLDDTGQAEGDEARHGLILAGRALASVAVDRF